MNTCSFWERFLWSLSQTAQSASITYSLKLSGFLPTTLWKAKLLHQSPALHYKYMLYINGSKTVAVLECCLGHFSTCFNSPSKFLTSSTNYIYMSKSSARIHTSDWYTWLHSTYSVYSSEGYGLMSLWKSPILHVSKHKKVWQNFRILFSMDFETDNVGHPSINSLGIYQKH